MIKRGLAIVLCALLTLSTVAVQVSAEQHVRVNPAPGPDPNQPDPNQPDLNQPDPNRPDPNQPDPNQPDPNRPNPNPPDPNRPQPPQPPQPPDPQGAIQVFVAVNGVTTGPFDRTQITAKIAGHEVDGTTLVWMEGFADWVPAATVAVLKPILAAAPPKPKFDSAAFMVGTWESSGTFAMQGMGRAQYSSTTTYNSDGTIVVYMTVVVPSSFQPVNGVITGQGTYKAETKTDTTFIVTPDMQLTSRFGNGVPDARKDNTPVLYTIIDRNTLSDPSGARYRRVGS